jgi:hypothetical protein
MLADHAIMVQYISRDRNYRDDYRLVSPFELADADI